MCWHTQFKILLIINSYHWIDILGVEKPLEFKVWKTSFNQQMAADKELVSSLDTQKLINTYEQFVQIILGSLPYWPNGERVFPCVSNFFPKNLLKH
jgi:hypothetical protein